jgi:hypothetical protein
VIIPTSVLASVRSIPWILSMVVGNATLPPHDVLTRMSGHRQGYDKRHEGKE